QVTINAPQDFSGSILASQNVCVGNATALSLLVSPTPSSVIWMRDDVQVGTGSSYLPTQSGSYWAVLTGGNGCKNYELVENPVSVVLRQPPFAGISGNTSLCYGDSGMLYGITTDPSA